MIKRKELISRSQQSQEVDNSAVYQEANKENQTIINGIVRDLLMEGSKFHNFSNLKELFHRSKQGHSCLIVMEHYSNFDIPVLFYFIGQELGFDSEAMDQIIAMAGFKLNAESPFVLAFTEAYTRIVIYPSRSLIALEGTDAYDAEKQKSREINRAALHHMIRRKHEGQIILLFPSGTRYRPGEENTRKGLSEVDSYIRGFDYMLPISIAGNILRINTQGDMSEDFVCNDVVIYKAGEILEAKKFRDEHRAQAADQDPKQYVADQIMKLLAKLHKDAKEIRKPLLPENHLPDED
jgi:glycerol-3-phosphate O-acyltransferase